MSKLNLLRQEFLKQLNHMAKYDGNWRLIDCCPLMSVSYEYFRNRHIERVTTFTPEEHSLLQQNLPIVYYYLGKRYVLGDEVNHMGPERVFDYAKFRSANQFLLDDVGKFVPDGVIKSDCIDGMLDSFYENKHLLRRSGSDWEIGDYPLGPVPDHNGVPESHDWWKILKESYGEFND